MMTIATNPETDYCPSQMSDEYLESLLNATLRTGGDSLPNRRLLYIAGFYSANPAHGMANAAKWFETALDRGWLPFVPHVSFMLDVVNPMSPQWWYEYDKALLLRCDAMFVCPDPLTLNSKGVRDEIVYATEHDIPVFHGDIPDAGDI